MNETHGGLSIEYQMGRENIYFETVQAMVYIMNDGHSFGAPSDYYLNTILEYTVAVPLKSLPDIYKNLETTLGRAITYEDQANASEIYYRIRIKT